MLKAPYAAESEYTLFPTPHEILSDSDFHEVEIVAEAFRGVLADRQLAHNKAVALAFIRRYAVTQAGLGNTEARLAYFEGQRRSKQEYLSVE